MGSLVPHEPVKASLTALSSEKVQSPEEASPEKKQQHQAGEMIQLIKESVAKPDDPSLIPRTHMVERENQLLQVVP